MGFFKSAIKSLQTQVAVSRLSDEALYAEAFREMESGTRRDGIWAMALADANMDQAIAAAKYIKMRVQSMKDEMALTAPLAAMRRREADRIGEQEAKREAERIAQIERELDEQKEIERERYRQLSAIRWAQEPPEDPKHQGCGGTITRTEQGSNVSWVCHKCRKKGTYRIGVQLAEMKDRR